MTQVNLIAISLAVHSILFSVLELQQLVVSQQHLHTLIHPRARAHTLAHPLTSLASCERCLCWECAFHVGKCLKFDKNVAASTALTADKVHANIFRSTNI